MKTLIEKYDAINEKILKTKIITEKEFLKIQKKNNPPLSELKVNGQSYYTFHCVENNRIVF